MLVDDALAMIVRSFADYRRSRQTQNSNSSSLQLSAAYNKNLRPSAVSESRQQTQSSDSISLQLAAVSEKLRPDAATRRLILLLSNDVELTYTELEHIISYLKFRQRALVST